VRLFPFGDQTKHAIGSLSESDFDKRWQEQVWDDQGNSLTLPLTAGDIKPALERGLAPLLEELEWFFKTLPEELMLTMRRDGILLAGGLPARFGYLVGKSASSACAHRA
jgi:hypothetical protein